MEQQKWHQVRLIELNCQHFNFRCQLELSVCVINPYETLSCIIFGFVIFGQKSAATCCICGAFWLWILKLIWNMQHPGCNVWARAASAAGIPVSVPFQSLWPTEDIKNWVKSHECSCVLSEPQCTNTILCLKELYKIDDPESFFLVISLLLIIWHSGCNLIVWWRIYQGTNMAICTGAQVHNLEYSVITQGPCMCYINYMHKKPAVPQRWQCRPQLVDSVSIILNDCCNKFVLCQTLLKNTSFLVWSDCLPSNLTGTCTLTAMTPNAHFLSFHSDNSEDILCNIQWGTKKGF